MTTERKSRLVVISNDKLTTESPITPTEKSYHSNPLYEKLLNFRNLQEAQKKKFSVEDLFKLC